MGTNDFTQAGFGVQAKPGIGEANGPAHAQTRYPPVRLQVKNKRWRIEQPKTREVASKVNAQCLGGGKRTSRQMNVLAVVPPYQGELARTLMPTLAELP